MAEQTWSLKLCRSDKVEDPLFGLDFKNSMNAKMILPFVTDVDDQKFDGKLDSQLTNNDSLPSSQQLSATSSHEFSRTNSLQLSQTSSQEFPRSNSLQLSKTSSQEFSGSNSLQLSKTSSQEFIRSKSLPLSNSLNSETIINYNLNHHHHITKKPDFSQACSQKRLISRQASENQHSPSSPPSMMPAQLQRQKSDIFNRQTIEEPREVLVRSMSAPHSFTCLKAKSLKICDNVPQITGRNHFSSIGKADFLTMMFDDKCSALSESEFPPQILRLLSEEEVKDIVDTY